MSDRHIFFRDGRLSGNYIPMGRQLPRTPPLMSVRKHLDFCNEDSNEDYQEPQQNMEADTRERENAMFDFTTIVTKAEPEDPNSVLKGMKGYQLTRSDLEFIQKMKEEKLVKKLQGDLAETKKLLKNETMAFELVVASREKAQAELKKFPSCEDLTDWIKVVLEMTSPLSELTDLNAKSLLAMVTRESIQNAIDEKWIELNEMKKMLENKRKKEAEERGQLEKETACQQLEIQGLMSQLSDLKSQLARQKEVYKALEIPSNIQETPEAEEVDPKDEVQAAKRRKTKPQGKGRTKAVNSAEKTQDTTNQSKSTKSKKADGESRVKDEDASMNKSETLKTKGPSTSQPAARSQGRKKAAVAAGDAAQEAQDTVLRRSKRIASRR